MLPKVRISTSKLMTSYNRKMLEEERKATELMKDRAHHHQSVLLNGKPLMELKKV